MPLFGSRCKSSYRDHSSKSMEPIEGLRRRCPINSTSFVLYIICASDRSYWRVGENSHSTRQHDEMTEVRKKVRNSRDEVRDNPLKAELTFIATTLSTLLDLIDKLWRTTQTMGTTIGIFREIENDPRSTTPKVSSMNVSRINRKYSLRRFRLGGAVWYSATSTQPTGGFAGLRRGPILTLHPCAMLSNRIGYQ